MTDLNPVGSLVVEIDARDLRDDDVLVLDDGDLPLARVDLYRQTVTATVIADGVAERLRFGPDDRVRVRRYASPLAEAAASAALDTDPGAAYTATGPRAEAGLVLGEEARQTERAEYEATEIRLREYLDDDDALSAVQMLTEWGWRPPGAVAALVAKARADGAAEEQERIVGSLRRYKQEPFALAYADAIEGSAEWRALAGES